MIGEQLKQRVDGILRVGIFKNPEHDSIDGLDEIISFIVNISGFEFLVNLCFVLVFIN